MRAHFLATHDLVNDYQILTNICMDIHVSRRKSKESIRFFKTSNNFKVKVKIVQIMEKLIVERRLSCLILNSWF